MSEQRFLDHLGVTAWHEAGYTGTRGLSGTAEAVSGGMSDHAVMTGKIFHLIAPDRKLIYIPYATSYIGGAYKSQFLEDGVPLIKEKHVDTMFMSLESSQSGRILNEGMEEVKDYFTFFVSAANDSSNSYNKYMEGDYIYGVGSYYLRVDGTMDPCGFSSESEYVDFSAPTLVYGFSGTSCSAPVLCGMAAIVNDFFIDKTGKPLSSEMMFKFLMDCSKDIDVIGKDIRTGWGAPILPRPEEVDITKYAEVETMIYKDDKEISSYHKNDVHKAYELGLMKGDGSNFNPKEHVTREQLASVIVRLYDMCK